MTVIKRINLLEVLIKYFSFDQLRSFALTLDVDLDNLPADSRTGKARELVAYLDRTGALGRLVELVVQARPDLSEQLAVESVRTGARAEPSVNSLAVDLASTRQQLIELQKEAAQGELWEQRLEEILKTVTRAVGESEEITARVIIPRREDMDVRLVPVHSLERLEEYRSDENIAYLLIGTFAGAVLGILSNWATNETFVITNFSLVLMSLLVTLTILCCLWVRRLNLRSVAVKQQINSASSDH